jgi:hypothetical protein
MASIVYSIVNLLIPFEKSVRESLACRYLSDLLKDATWWVSNTCLILLTPDTEPPFRI